MKIIKKLKRWVCAAAALALLAFPMSNVSASGTQVNMFADNTAIKGIQGIENIAEEHGTYGTNHRLINININECYISEIDPWVLDGLVPTVRYHDKDYHFIMPRDRINVYRDSIRQAVLNNESISVVFVMQWDDECAWLIDDAARERSDDHTYYALETEGEAGEWLGAFFTYICQELLLGSYKSTDLRIDNFILGNEVNMPNQWNYFGSTDTWTCATKYADAFRIMYNTVREYSSTARCSISLDHSWNDNDEGRGMAGREFLDVFASQLGPDVDWCVSYHLYPSILFKPEIWTDYEGMDLNPVSDDARFVDGRNLSIMTNYVKNKYGEQHRIMLTEQGFSKSLYEENIQAAALAWSYYAALYDPMVDSFILNNKNEGGNLDFSLGGLADEVYRKIGNGNAEDQAEIASWCLPIIGVGSWSEIIPNYGVDPEPWQPEEQEPEEPADPVLVGEFVTRLYEACLGRTPDENGYAYWTSILIDRTETGSQVAYGFVTSDEFKGKNYCNEHYVTYLYRAMMGREPDGGGLAYWVDLLESGQNREEVFNGFVVSDEFTGLCEACGIRRGNGVSVPQYGTVPTGACSIDGTPDGVTTFVKRMYNECLDRDPEDGGLDYWRDQLWSHASSGRDVAHGFVFSDEFTGKNLSNEEFVEYMYKVFFGRGSDEEGKAYWLNLMANGWGSEQVFDGFVVSEEFDTLCKRCGIVRG